MLYSIFIYQRGAGNAIWQKSFKDSMDQSQLQMYSSFFSAIQTFVRNISKGSNTQLNTLDLGNLIVHITTIHELDVDLVTIAERKDQKVLSSIHEKLIAVLMYHQKIFPNWQQWDGNVEIFKELDYDIFETLLEFKTLFKEEQESDIFNRKTKSNIESLRKEQITIIQQEIEDKFGKLKQLKTPLEKLDHLEKIQEYIIQHPDIQVLNRINETRNTILREIQLLKDKINYYLRQAKEETVKISEYPEYSSNPWNNPKMVASSREIYMHLYSASTKIKALGLPKKAEEIKELADHFMVRNGNYKQEVHQHLRKVLLIPDNVDVLLEIT